MSGGHAGEAGVAAGGAVEVFLVATIRIIEQGSANEVADASRLERAGWLEILELEQDAAACGFGEGGGFNERS